MPLMPEVLGRSRRSAGRARRHSWRSLRHRMRLVGGRSALPSDRHRTRVLCGKAGVAVAAVPLSLKGSRSENLSFSVLAGTGIRRTRARPSTQATAVTASLARSHDGVGSGPFWKRPPPAPTRRGPSRTKPRLDPYTFGPYASLVRLWGREGDCLTRPATASPR